VAIVNYPDVVRWDSILTIQKNPLAFLDVAKRVVAARPDVQFVMAGDGGMLPQLMERACVMGIAGNVLFTGKVSSREASELYARASCFVMPSLSEPFGLVALEAASHGTPVIVSRQSGVAEVLEHAFVVDHWDTALMADCIVTVLREQALGKHLRTEAPKSLARLRWEHQAGKVHSLYQSLIHD
jgi:glycosyltransferase involved in cell wall biosynthesis